MKVCMCVCLDLTHIQPAVELQACVWSSKLSASLIQLNHGFFAIALNVTGHHFAESGSKDTAWTKSPKALTGMRSQQGWVMKCLCCSSFIIQVVYSPARLKGSSQCLTMNCVYFHGRMNNTFNGGWYFIIKETCHWKLKQQSSCLIQKTEIYWPRLS